MAKMLQLKSKNPKITKDEFFSDSDLISLITSVINKEAKFKNIPKGVWFWNCSDNKFLCSASFRELMNISISTNPDLDFWMNYLAPEDLDTLVEALTGVILDSKPRNFICWIAIPKIGKQIFQCFTEPLTNPMGKRYIIGVFCNISERIFSDHRN
jgi:hypothetical protein